MDKNARTDFFRGLGYAIFGLCTAYAGRFGIHYDAEKQAFFAHRTSAEASEARQ